MNEEDAAYVIRQVLSAITYCHAKGVVHRDLKPENILIDSIAPDGKINIKVIDFGTALFFTPQSKLRETLGTPYYIAPEVLMGNYTEKCDEWSIGVILFVLLSGTAPFNGVTDEDILNAVKTGKYTFKSTGASNAIGKGWESVSASAKDLINKLLAYSQELRLSSAEAYQHPWIQSKKFNTLNATMVQELVDNMNHFYVHICGSHRSLNKNYNRQQ